MCIQVVNLFYNVWGIERIDFIEYNINTFIGTVSW